MSSDLNINNKKNVTAAILRPKRPLLEPIAGNTNNPRIIRNKKKNLIFLRIEKNIPARTGRNEDKMIPKEFGSLKVELILFNRTQNGILPKLDE